MHHLEASLPVKDGRGGPRLVLGDIFRVHGEAHRKSHALSEPQRKAMRAVEACRTPVLGGRVEVCDRCAHREVFYGSCRNRHCPTCQSLSQARWIEGRMERLLPTDYFHVVFTVPDNLLNGLILRNRELFFDLLFQAGSQTLLELGADPKRLGAQLGATCVLHTWTRDLRFHAHLHCIVTGGGLHADADRWVRPRSQDFLFPKDVLSALFSKKLLALLAEAKKDGELAFSGSCAELADPSAFARWKDRLYKTKWVAYCKKPFAGPEQVFRYLGRYTHRVGISNQRLLQLSDGAVRFRTKGEQTATLTPDEFIHRWLQHVLPDRFVKIRHYGLMASSNATTKLEVARRLLEAEQPELPLAVATYAGLLLAALAGLPGPRVPLEGWRARLQRLTGVDSTRCPVCRIGTMTISALPRGRRTQPDDTS